MGHFDKTPPTQVEDLAKKVTEQVSNGHLDDAYKMLKTEVESDFKTMPLEEKRQTWNALSKILEDNGTLPKLAAVWLTEKASNTKPQDVAITKEQLDSQSKNALDPFYSGFAGEMSKQFSVASKLSKDDGVIDSDEVAGFRKRALQATPEKFADDLVKKVENDLAVAAMTQKTYEKNPEQSPNANAYTDLLNTMAERRKAETPDEEAATWKIVDQKLNEKGLIPKLSMGYLDSTWKTASVSLELMKSNTTSQNIVGRELAGYIVDQFPKIGTVDYHLTDISLNEREIYDKKLSDHK